ALLLPSIQIERCCGAKNVGLLCNKGIRALPLPGKSLSETADDARGAWGSVGQRWAAGCQDQHPPALLFRGWSSRIEPKLCQLEGGRRLGGNYCRKIGDCAAGGCATSGCGWLSRANPDGSWPHQGKGIWRQFDGVEFSCLQHREAKLVSLRRIRRSQ